VRAHGEREHSIEQTAWQESSEQTCQENSISTSLADKVSKKTI